MPEPADFHSAVSPGWTRPGLQIRRSACSFGRLAEWNSAIQQIENLRYAALRTERRALPARIKTKIGITIAIEIMKGRERGW